jgi:hypothetical protein
VVTTASGDRSPWLTRPVLLAGLAAGTFVTASAVYGGARPHLTSLPLFLPLVFGVLAELLAVIAVATVLAAVLRRYHRALLSGARRHGSRYTAAAFLASRRHGGSLRDRLAGWAAPRWAARVRGQLGGRDGGDQPGAGLDNEHDQQNGDDPMTNDVDEKAFWRDRNAALQREGLGRAAGPGPARRSRSTSAGWKTLAADAADYEPEDDADLLAWMGDQVAGMLGYGEAVASVHEHCVNAVRLDPAAMATLHDVADAVADAAEAMARAIEKFKQVYEGPREFVSDGGVLPRDGDFLTGDGD